MLRSLLLMGSLVLGATLLSACQGSYNPQTSRLSPHDACVALQRKMVFDDNFRTSNVSEFDRTNNRASLMKSYTTMHCQDILAKQKHA